VLVTLDTVRADALSCYGARAHTTAALDALAREGVLYERAYSPVPITLPAHASLLTGLYPLRHGLRDNGIAALAPSVRTLAEAAREGGVQTAAFVGAVVLDRNLGLDQGFEVYDGPPLQRATSGHPFDRPASEVLAGARTWLEARDPARPFFLWVHLYDAHHPYTPRVPTAGTELERYLGEVRELDAELGAFLAFLRARALLDEAFLCVTADHGEAFGEHLELSHGPFCFETTLRVPLILRHPDGRDAGRRSRELVSLVDLAPTLAGALGVSLGSELDGRSLLAPATTSHGLYFESFAGHLAFDWSPLAGWIDDQGKYLHGSAPQFFELEADPGETRDLAGERDDLLRYRTAIGALAARPAHRGEGGAIDAELQAGIQGLGYAAFDATDGGFPHPLAPSDRPFPHAMVGAWRESMLAQEHLAQGRFEEAERLLLRLCAAEPTNPFLRLQLGTASMRLKKFQEAMDSLRPLLDAPVVRPQALFKLALCAERLGQREEAVRHLERALTLAPNERRYRERLEALRAGRPTGEDE
jgi:arylsulfatase A-like enzyme